MRPVCANTHQSTGNPKEANNQVKTYVDHLNRLFPELHPHASLRQGANYLFEQGQLKATVAGFVLETSLVRVMHADIGEPFGHRARLHVSRNNEASIPPEAIYREAANADDAVFLDRFLRTFHALNYLHEGHHPWQHLVLDVHLRHVSGLPNHHGKVFESLLRDLGLQPDQIVLRLDTETLHEDTHIQRAVRSFSHHGYHLLAVRPVMKQTDWDMLSDLGVEWISPHTRDLEAWHRGEPEGNWGYEAAAGCIGLWLDGVNSMEALQLALTLGADLIEGDLAEPDAWQTVLRKDSTHWTHRDGDSA